MRSSLRAAAAAWIALFVLSGCSPGAHPLARVGSHTVTVDQLARLARGSEGSFSPIPDAARAKALDEMVQRELLLVAAQRHGLDTTSATRELRRTTGEKLLVRALQAQFAPADPGVSEAEVRTLYAQRAVEADVHLVYAADRQTIAMARGAIAAGQPFARVADHFSSPGLLPPGGAVGAMQAGALPPPLDEALRTQKAGAVGGPYETSQGWFLLMVTNRKPAHQEAYELEHDQLANLIRQRKQRGGLTTAMLELERSVHLRLTTGAEQVLFRLLSPARVPELQHWTPTAQERRDTLAHFDGGAYTVDDMLGDLMRNDSQLPNAAMLPSLRAWIQSRAMLRAQVIEARRRHLDQDPAYVQQLGDIIDNSLVETETNRALASTPSPDEAAVRTWWNGVKDQNPALQQVHVQWVVLSDTTRAAAIASRCRAGMSLLAAVQAAAPGLRVQEQVVRFPGRDPAWAPLAEVLGRMQPGQVSGPDFLNDGWHITQLLDRVQGPVEWDQLTPDLQRNVAGRVAQIAGIARCNAYVDSLRKVIQPVVLSENLRYLPWPIPAPVELGQ